MIRDVFCQSRAGHIRNELKGIDGDTQKGDDVWVRQVFPHYCNLVEGLRVSSASVRGKTWSRERTLLTFRRFPLGCIPTRLMRTLEPLRVPSFTSPEASERLTSERGSESVQYFGNTSLTLHILLSSRKGSCNARPAGLETPPITYLVLSAE